MNKTDEVTKELIREKLLDAATPGYAVEFDAREAEQAGAFAEDGLSEADAADSVHDENGGA
ncbi:hypothetical protein [Pseudomonas sp. PDM20]|uniref:hypothetical protein n=1 Tax=Pseudomonas sp. PDM20 TaxID=2769254 RepID=UPI001785D724|nr:hypothetical protein [Pseudomonas sp. PDM20]MBD9686833.1 hypothetical protein [Pseudomonas sp. PDM20]